MVVRCGVWVMFFNVELVGSGMHTYSRRLEGGLLVVWLILDGSKVNGGDDMVVDKWLYSFGQGGGILRSGR